MIETTPQVVVLGASGYVGSAVTAALASRPGRLRAVSRRPCPLPDVSRAEVDVMVADLTDPVALAAAVADADVVLHLVKPSSWRDSEQDPAAGEAVNVAMMDRLVEVVGAQANARPLPPLVLYAGTCMQVGRPPSRPLDGSERDDPRTVHDRQKLSAEQLLMRATAAGSVRGVSLRIGPVFGRSWLSGALDSGVVATMIRRALADEPLTMWHDGSVGRDLTHVDDIARAFLAALDRPDDIVGRHWLVGAGRRDRLDEVFRIVANSVASRTGRPPVAVESVPPPTEAQATDFWSVFIDPRPFSAATGWSAQVSLREGVDHAVHSLLCRRGAGHSMWTSGT